MCFILYILASFLPIHNARLVATVGKEFSGHDFFELSFKQQMDGHDISKSES